MISSNPRTHFKSDFKTKFSIDSFRMRGACRKALGMERLVCLSESSADRGMHRISSYSRTGNAEGNIRPLHTSHEICSEALRQRVACLKNMGKSGTGSRPPFRHKSGSVSYLSSFRFPRGCPPPLSGAISFDKRTQISRLAFFDRSR